MAYLTNIDDVIDFVKNNDAPYWTIRDQSGNKIAEQQNEDVELPASIKMLHDVLSRYEDGGAKLCITHQKIHGNKGAAGAFKVWYHTPRAAAGVTGTETAGANKQVLDLIERIHHVEKSALQREHERQLEDLKRELTRKEKQPSVTDRFVESLMSNPAIGSAIAGIIGKFAGAPAPIAGNASIQGHVDELPADQQTKIENAINTLLEVDADFANTITILADFAKRKPDQFRGFIPMLKSMAG